MEYRAFCFQERDAGPVPARNQGDRYTGVTRTSAPASVELFVSARIAATLSKHIPHIVRVRSNEQVTRINASWNVALMKNKFSAGNFSDEKLIGNAMSAAHPAIEFDKTVAVFI
jgi:hypothetical protein